MDIFNHVDGSETHLPPGFRFHPTDEELITYYLMKKVLDSSFTGRAIADVDLNKCEPWELPERAKLGEEEWYFYSLRDRKYPTGLRTNRATEAGYWKATGKDREIYSSKTGSLVGMKKTLVFYKGRAPKGEKSNWVMHEYRLEGKLSYHYLCRGSKDEWVVSRVFQKCGGSSGGKKARGGCSVGGGGDGGGGGGGGAYLEKCSTSSSSSLPQVQESSPYSSLVAVRESGALERESKIEPVPCFSNVAHFGHQALSSLFPVPGGGEPAAARFANFKTTVQDCLQMQFLFPGVAPLQAPPSDHGAAELDVAIPWIQPEQRAARGLPFPGATELDCLWKF